MPYLLAAIALYFLAKRMVPHWTAWRRRSAAERSFAMRFMTFACLLTFIFLVAALHLPPLGCVILMVPIFLTGMTLSRWWQNSRERLRRQAEEASSFERARRIN